VTDISISLPPELLQFIASRVQSGRNTSSSDVIRDALIFLERAETAQAEAGARLRHAWREGVSSADVGEVDFDALKSEARRRLNGAG
jgi:antitoxin ParD1/3/4